MCVNITLLKQTRINMKKEAIALKEVYLNLWFRGILCSFLGILNMMYLVSAAYNMLNGENTLSWITAINVLGVLLFSRESAQLQNKRRVIFSKIKESL